MLEGPCELLNTATVCYFCVAGRRCAETVFGKRNTPRVCTAEIGPGGLIRWPSSLASLLLMRPELAAM